MLEELSGQVKVSGFADDLAVWCTGSDMRRNRERIQGAVDTVWRWSEEWLMVVAVEKCSVTLFSKDSKDTEMRAVSDIVMNGQALRVEKTPKFLGISYDRSLTFNHHCRIVVQKARKRVSLLRALAGKDWGWSRKLMVITYTALIKAIVMYESAAWAPWISKTEWNKMEAVQREAGRVIAGMVSSSPAEAILAETGLNELEREAEGSWLIEYEKSLRENEKNPKSELVRRVVRQRLKRVGWRRKCEEIFEVKTEGPVTREMYPEMRAPWSRRVEIEFDCRGKKMEDRDKMREEALERLRETDGDVTIYTDGSAKEGRMDGGAACVVTTGSAETPIIVESRT